MSWFSPPIGHTVMHACTCTHKHNDVCVFLPRYIIISTLHGLAGVLDSWEAEERRKEGENSKLGTAGGQFTALC